MNEAACASGDPHSTRIGAAVLEAGGSAVDAAIAAAWMACFSAPTMTGVGGAGLMTIWNDGSPRVVDFFSTLPGMDRLGAPPAMTPVEVIFDGVAQEFSAGVGSCAVPGTVAGLFHVHERFGTMPMKELMAPTIRAARTGVEVSTNMRRAIRLLKPIFLMSEASWHTISVDNRLLEVGEIYRHAALADLFELLADEGPTSFYDGPVARALTASTHGGITASDLKEYRVRETSSLSFPFRGATVHCPRAPSLTSGLLARSMQSLATFPAGIPPSDPRPHRALIEAMLRGDSLRTTNYERKLFDDEYLEGVVARTPGGSTLHCSTADAKGNVVAYTTTLGEGSGVMAGNTGIHLNNFMGEDDIFNPSDGHTPGERMVTSTCPMIAVADDGRRIAMGAAGSKRIRTAIMQVLDHTLRESTSLHESVARPRLHVEGGILHVETFDRHVDELEAIRSAYESYKRENSGESGLVGELVDMVESNAPGYFFGAVQAVAWSPTGVSAAADNARRGCEAREVRVRTEGA